MPTKGTPFVLDIATTATSHGTIKVHAREGTPMPEGWVVDADGRPITDPARAGEGFLVPMGGYKGSGLTIAIGLLAGVLNGAAFGRDVVDHRRDQATPTNTGQSILVMRPDLFRPQATKSSPTSPATSTRCGVRAVPTGGRCACPATKPRGSRAENQEHGVPLSRTRSRANCTNSPDELGVDSPFTKAETR